MSSEIASARAEFCQFKSPQTFWLEKLWTIDFLPDAWLVSLLWRVISHRNGAAGTLGFTVTAPDQTLNLLPHLLWPTL